MATLYEDEQGISSHGPPEGWAPKAGEVQLRLLGEIWSGGLKAPPSTEALLMPYATKRDASSIVLPDGAEGFFFQAKFSAILKRVKGDKGMPDYDRVLKYLFAMLRERRANFYDRINGNIVPFYEHPLEAWWKRRLEYEAGIQGDFVAYAGHTGTRHRNWSVRASRVFMEQSQCWVGTTSPDGSQILLVHPERLDNYDHLGMDCAGSELAPWSVGDFYDAPNFCFCDDKLYFSSDNVSRKNPYFGSAALCLPGVA